MKKSIRICLSALIVTSLITNVVNAQEKKPPVKPVPGAQARKAPSPVRPGAPLSKFALPVQYLMKFTGRWNSNAAFISDGKTDTVKYQFTARGTAEGYGLLLEESFSDSIKGKMRGVNLAAYDSLDGKIHWYSVTNQDGPHDHTGTWLSPDSLYLEHKSVRKGKTYAEKITFAFKGREELTLVFVATLDGKETQRINAVFQRDMPPLKKPTPAPEKEKKD
jgi:hypothetical protein